ncbi:MAG TPA: ribosome assembly cofactor RimP [Bacteroidia bacterium]|nr:ribosome assembly cofactor RimP [Bacteroidia bacterium]
MISQEFIRKLAGEKLKDSDSWLVDVQVSPLNRIRISIDSFQGVSIEQCVAMSRWIEGNLDRAAEDFELEVTSPGLDQPFRVTQQYEKNLGKEVEVKKTDGTKITGKLLEYNDNELTIEQQSKEKLEGKKGKKLVMRKLTIPRGDIRETRLVIKF